MFVIMWFVRCLIMLASYQSMNCASVTNTKSQSSGSSTKTESGASKSESKSQHSKSSKHSSNSKQTYSYKISHSSHSSPYISSISSFNFPPGYGLKYASDYDGYVSLPLDIDPDLDPDLNLDFIHSDIDDLDYDLDFNDIDLDLDFLKLKYGLYGLNYYSSHIPHFNEYKFRRRYRYRPKPYYRLRHRYYPRYWDPELYWNLDSYSMGYDYGSYEYEVHTPHSHVHVQRY